MDLFIDTEFDGFGGDLISMAIVSETGVEFYEVVKYGLSDWVKANVNPVLGKEAINMMAFRGKLEAYLNQFSYCNVIADWPEDLKHFFDVILTGPGVMMRLPTITARLDRDVSSRDSKVPHNALEDARAIRNSYIKF